MNYNENIRKVIKVSLGSSITFIIFCFAKQLAFYERGYVAVGGEYLILLLPFIICIAIDTYKKNKITPKNKERSIQNANGRSDCLGNIDKPRDS